MKNEEQAEVTAIVDALATLDGMLSSFSNERPALAEWGKHASRVVNLAAAAILEQAVTCKLQETMIVVLEGLHACAIDERNAARAALDAIRG